MNKLAAKRRPEKRVGRASIGDVPKVHIGFRLDADVVAAIRPSGPGSNDGSQRDYAQRWQGADCSLHRRQLWAGATVGVRLRLKARSQQGFPNHGAGVMFRT